MPIPVSDLDNLDNLDLADYMRPIPVEAGRGDLMLSLAVDAIKEAIAPATTVPASAKAVVLEVAARAYRPQVQQESLGSRSVSYFQPSDPRSGVFLTEEDLRQLGVFNPGVGVAWMRSPNGAGR